MKTDSLDSKRHNKPHRMVDLGVAGVHDSSARLRPSNSATFAAPSSSLQCTWISLSRFESLAHGSSLTVEALLVTDRFLCRRRQNANKPTATKPRTRIVAHTPIPSPACRLSVGFGLLIGEGVEEAAATAAVVVVGRNVGVESVAARTVMGDWVLFEAGIMTSVNAPSDVGKRMPPANVCGISSIKPSEPRAKDMVTGTINPGTAVTCSTARVIWVPIAVVSIFVNREAMTVHFQKKEKDGEGLLLLSWRGEMMNRLLFEGPLRPFPPPLERHSR